MFINCPFCGFLVALDAQGEPLPRCPNCAQRLRDDVQPLDEDAQPPAPETATASAPTPSYVPPPPMPAPAQEATPAATEPAEPAAPEATQPEPAAEDAVVDTTAPREAAPAADMVGEPATEPAAEPAPAPAPPLLAAPAPIDPASLPVAIGAPAIPDAAPEPAAAAEAALADEHEPPGDADDTGAPEGATQPEALPEADTAVAPATAADDEAAAADADAPIAAATPQRRARTAAAAPSFARATGGARPVSRKRRAFEIGAVIGLLLLLAVQLLVADRARLAADASWRPLVMRVCGALGCNVPAWREPSAFRIVERDVRARAPGALRVSARIRNDARWAQPWPALQLTLSDAHGREVATRIFQPREYLGGAPTQARLESGQDASLSMDIVEPGSQAVAFTFDFK